MKIFDGHNHANLEYPINPEKYIADLKSVGISGGCVYSAPIYYDMVDDPAFSFDKRLDNVMAWTEGYDNLFPVMWIHPFEKNLRENVKKAVDRGVVAFKFICDKYYPEDERCMDILRYIAELGKPVIFHSGMLWCPWVAIKYGRPINFECLVEIDGLKAALCHGGWPWCEEEIALYGRFLYANKQGHGADIYLDLCPGTPKISRRDMYEKIFNLYPLEDKIMFGVDSGVHAYDTQMAKDYIDMDTEIFDAMGISDEVREKFFYKNYMRFLGIEESKVFK